MLYTTQVIGAIVSHFNILGLMFTFMAFIIRTILEVCQMVFVNLSQMILASNSRTNEIQADTFAYDAGYGRELISALYLLQKISINRKVKLSERMKATHPHIAYRIRHLEELGSEG